MLKTIKKWINYALIFSLMLSPNALAQEPPTNSRIKVAVTSNNFYALTLTKNKFKGTLAPLAQCIFDKMSYDFEFWSFPHARLLKLIEYGHIDVGLPLVRTADRDNYAVHTKPIAVTKFIIYSKKPVDAETKLNQLSFVISRGSVCGEIIANENGTYHEVANWQHALQLVQIARYDATIIPDVVSNTFDPKILENLYQYELTELEIAIYITNKSEKLDELLKAFNSAIDHCSSAPLIKGNI